MVTHIEKHGKTHTTTCILCEYSPAVDVMLDSRGKSEGHWYSPRVSAVGDLDILDEEDPTWVLRPKDFPDNVKRRKEAVKKRKRESCDTSRASTPRSSDSAKAKPTQRGSIDESLNPAKAESPLDLIDQDTEYHKAWAVKAEVDDDLDGESCTWISSSSSKKARTKEMMAANRRILTSRSSNCSRTNCHRDLPSSAGNSAKTKQRHSRFLKGKVLHHGKFFKKSC